MKDKGVLPATIQVTPVKADELVPIKAAARLAGIHPEILVIGQRMLKTGEASAFKLGDPKMLERAGELENAFAKGLRRVVKALSGGSKKAKTFLDYEQKRIVMWVE